MSAHAFIQYADVPERLMTTAARQRDDVTGAHLITFEGYPLCGEIAESDSGLQIVFAWPHNAALRHQLGDWLTHNGLSFVVVM